MAETKTSECVEVRSDSAEVRTDTRLKKLELLNPERIEEIKLFVRGKGMSDYTYWRLKTGATKGRAVHINVLNELVQHLGLLEE